MTAEELVRRPGIEISDLAGLSPAFSDADPAAAREAGIAVKYAGYFDREEALICKAQAMEETLLPEDTPYAGITALRVEAREKLAAQRPRSLGQASRIPGVNPADIAVLMVWLKARAEQETQDAGERNSHASD